MKKCKTPIHWCLYLKSVYIDGILQWECIHPDGGCKNKKAVKDEN